MRLTTAAPLLATLILAPACVVGETDSNVGSATHRADLAGEWLEVTAEPVAEGLVGYAFVVSHGSDDFATSILIDEVPSTLDQTRSIRELFGAVTPELLDHSIADLSLRLATAPTAEKPALEAIANLLPLAILSLDERDDVIAAQMSPGQSKDCLETCKFTWNYSTDDCMDYCGCRSDGGSFWHCSSKHLWKLNSALGK